MVGTNVDADVDVDVDVDVRIAAFLDRYEPAIETKLSEARRQPRALFPRGYELVFDNYNALVFGISATDRSTGSFVSVAGYPRWVRLFFRHGAGLDDPHGLLDGEGKQVRPATPARPTARSTRPTD